MHDQRTRPPETAGEYEIGQRKRRMQRDQIVRSNAALQPERIGRRNRQREQVSERAHALDRNAV
ncbi:MAG: hypothetical protein E6614_20880, partial [Bradyrhizobium sp.]|nr:hypothetical protein [Bradyrhizobium sp.]